MFQINDRQVSFTHIFYNSVTNSNVFKKLAG